TTEGGASVVIELTIQAPEETAPEGTTPEETAPKETETPEA
ncbi:30S ribosomal protein S3, partial [Streptomyces sp. SID7499]|nr:30S ribosomal protein S3 [Streptomyces sp. SID7499]